MTSIYIAGPMSGHMNYNYPAFHAAARCLRQLGLTIISPAEDDKGRPLNPPTLGAAKPHAEYMRDGLNKLLRCEAIYMLPGWQHSKGATLEHDVAKACGMTMLYAEQPETTP